MIRGLKGAAFCCFDRSSGHMEPSLAALFVPLATSRLVLEPVAERHAEAMFAVLGDAALYRYMPSEAASLPVTVREDRSRSRAEA